MHCELVVPGLFSRAGGDRRPALELLLARGRASPASAQSLEEWFAEAFDLGEEPVPAGALTMMARGAHTGDALWARADPVHLRVMRDRLAVLPSEAFHIAREEAQALCDALNRHFEGVLELTPVEPQRWCARLAQPIELDARPPLEAAGTEVDARPTRWSAMLNEMQMLLHAHPVNEAREERVEPTVNSVWLWGLGRAPRTAHSRWQSVAAEDPVALGLARLAAVRARDAPRSAQAWLSALPEEGRHLTVLDTLRAPLALGDDGKYREGLAALEARWFAPLLEALKEGRIGMVTIHVPDAGAAFETIRADLRRFWRRPRALEHYA
jgi:hypothetical protein